MKFNLNTNKASYLFIGACGSVMTAIIAVATLVSEISPASIL